MEECCMKPYTPQMLWGNPVVFKDWGKFYSYHRVVEQRYFASTYTALTEGDHTEKRRDYYLKKIPLAVFCID